jgi:WD40 repeat protein
MVSTGREVSTVIPQQADNHRQLPFLAFSSDGRTFATVNWRSSVAQLWDVNTGNLISTITIPSTEPASSLHTRSIGALAFHPTRKALAVAANERGDGGNSSLQLWDVSTGKFILTLTEHPMLFPLAVNEKTILCFSANNFQLRDTNTGKMLRDLKETGTNLFKHFQKVGSVDAFAVLSDNTTFAIGGTDGLLELWNMHADERLLTLKGHTEKINALALTADDTILASSSQDRSIRLWDTRTGSKLLTLTKHKNSGKRQVFTNAPTRFSSELVNNLVFSSDGKMLASSSEHGTIWLWDLSTRNLLKTLTMHEAAADMLLAGTGLAKIGIAFSPDNKLFASGGMNGQMMLSEVKDNSNDLLLNGHTWSVKALTFSPDGKLLASGSKDNTIRLWNTETGTEIAILRGHSTEIYILRFSVDGSTLVSGSGDGTIFLWDRDKIVTSGKSRDQEVAPTEEIR